MPNGSFPIVSFLPFLLTATIFAYGQTSSGKTFTMRGITENAVRDIFEHIKNVSHSSYYDLLYSFWNPLVIAVTILYLCPCCFLFDLVDARKGVCFEIFCFGDI